MLSTWQRRTVSDLQRAGVLLVEDGNHGESRPRPDEFDTAGVHFVRAADMDHGRVLFDRASRINEVARRRITKGIGAPRDVLLSHKGTVGKIALVSDDAPSFVCSPQTTFWRSTNAALNYRYLYAFMRSPDFHRQLHSRAGETDMAPYVSLTAQRTLEVVIPTPKEQQGIASMLGALDDKIELNRRTNETLEAMARALFQSWFVDFDPVRATDAIVETATVDELTGRKILAIGDGYRAKNNELGDQGLPFARAGDINAGQVGDTVDHLLPERVRFAGDKVSMPGDVLFTSKGTVGRFALVRGGRQFVYSPQLCFWRSLDGKRLPPLYLFHWMRSEAFVRQINQVKGQTDMADYVSLRDQRAMRVQLPAPEACELFVRAVAPLDDQYDSLRGQSHSLTTLRDALLPRLLSGELRIPDAERAVSAVL